MTSRAPPAMQRAYSGLQKQKGGGGGDACLIGRARRPLLLPATLMSWNWTRQSLIPKGNESYLELKSVLTMTTNYASRFTLLFSVALETSRAGMVCECRNNRSIAVRVRRPSAGAGGAARIGGASFAKLIHSVPSLPPPKRPFSNAPLPLSVA